MSIEFSNPSIEIETRTFGAVVAIWIFEPNCDCCVFDEAHGVCKRLS